MRAISDKIAFLLALVHIIIIGGSGTVTYLFRLTRAEILGFHSVASGPALFTT